MCCTSAQCCNKGTDKWYPRSPAHRHAHCPLLGEIRRALDKGGPRSETPRGQDCASGFQPRARRGGVDMFIALGHPHQMPWTELYMKLRSHSWHSKPQPRLHIGQLPLQHQHLCIVPVLQCCALHPYCSVVHCTNAAVLCSVSVLQCCGIYQCCSAVQCVMQYSIALCLWWQCW